MRREYEISADAHLAELLVELGQESDEWSAEDETTPPELLVPLRLRFGDDILSFISTTTVFGTPREVTLSELAIEAFHPADDRTRALLVRGVSLPPREDRMG